MQVRIETMKHYLSDGIEKPFFMRGEAVTADLDHVYLEARRARGFTTMLVNLLEHRLRGTRRHTPTS